MNLTPSLDDPEALAAADPGEMLRQVASAAAQIRQARLLAAEAGLARIADEGRPRAVVVVGMGGSGISGDVLAAVCGNRSPVPVVTVRGYTLPGWVGVPDLVIAVSCSGATEETLAATVEAIRRGCRLVCVGAPDSPLAEMAPQGRALFVPVHSVGQPRASLWALTVPLLVAASALGLADVSDAVLETTALRLEEIGHRCGPGRETYLNPGKQLAAGLAGALPMIWGSSPLAGVAAYRFACQLNENAGCPATHGELLEASHNQIVALDGFFGRDRGTPGSGSDDFFRDRADESDAGLHMILLRDTEEHPQVVKRREVATELAHDRGVPVTQLVAEGSHPLERIATLIALTDYATVYLAIALGVDPTPVAAIQTLKARIAR